MAGNTKVFPKSKQRMKRLKIVTLHKSKVAKDVILHQFKVHKATYYCTVNKMKPQRAWLRKGNFTLQKRDI